MPHRFRAPILSYEDINESATGFLEQKGLDDNFPNPIDEVVEFDYSIDIVPFPNLQGDFDIDGFMSGDLSRIYIDDFIFKKRPFRYRFTLAHEIGHLILHKDLMYTSHQCC